MALDVILYSPTGTSYSLKVDRIEHTVSRLAAQSGLPADPDSKAPKDMILDLGICLQQIVITGTVDVTGTPSKSNLETASTTWWVTTTTKTDMSRLVISGTTYYGVIRNASFAYVAGVPEKWDFSITFMVTQGLE